MTKKELPMGRDPKTIRKSLESSRVTHRGRKSEVRGRRKMQKREFDSSMSIDNRKSAKPSIKPGGRLFSQTMAVNKTCR